MEEERIQEHGDTPNAVERGFQDGDAERRGLLFTPPGADILRESRSIKLDGVVGGVVEEGVAEQPDRTLLGNAESQANQPEPIVVIFCTVVLAHIAQIRCIRGRLRRRCGGWRGRRRAGFRGVAGRRLGPGGYELEGYRVSRMVHDHVDRYFFFRVFIFEQSTKFGPSGV